MMDTAHAVDLAGSLVRPFEGLRLSPYLCPAGVPTIGYGATYYEDGRRVTLKDPAITRERAVELLNWHLTNRYLPDTLVLCPGVRTDFPLAALIDFCYNLGAGNLRASTLRRHVNAGRWDLVPGELRKWVRGGGRVLPGLVKRREAEITMSQRTA